MWIKSWFQVTSQGRVDEVRATWVRSCRLLAVRPHNWLISAFGMLSCRMKRVAVLLSIGWCEDKIVDIKHLDTTELLSTHVCARTCTHTHTHTHTEKYGSTLSFSMKTLVWHQRREIDMLPSPNPLFLIVTKGKHKVFNYNFSKPF